MDYNLENIIESFDNKAASTPPSPLSPKNIDKKTKKRSSKKTAADAEELPVCPICCETYNKSLRIKIVCSYEDCHYTACKTCVRTYLTSTVQDPHCMNCKKPFDDEFMFKHLNKSYCKTEFRDHRRKILFDLEVSKIPDTIPAVENFLKIEEYQNKNLEINIKISELHREIRDAERNINENNRQIGILRGYGGEKSLNEKRKFIMACPNEDCRGFLSTSYKCEICKNYTCPHCLELIGKEKTGVNQEREDGELEIKEHICNPDCVKNAEMIKKDTRACPSCGTRIYKIEGCSQIWCTSCHVAFNWNTGRIDNGTIHNPHFFEWQQKGGGSARIVVNGGAAAGAALNPCENANNARNWDNYRRNIFQYTDRWSAKLREYIAIHNEEKFVINNTMEKIHLIRKYIMRFARLTRTIEHVVNEIMCGDRMKIENLSNHDTARILYILKRLSGDDFANIIYKNSIQRKKLMEKHHIYELLTTICREWFNTFSVDEDYLVISNEIYYIKSINEIDHVTSKILEKYKKNEEEIIEFIKYCNQEFYRIGTLYNERAFNINLIQDVEGIYNWSYISSKNIPEKTD